MRSIIGIDPGLTSTGFGVIKADRRSYSHIQHGVIHTDRLQSRGERLVHLYRSLDGILAEFNPQEAGLESIFFAKNVKTAMPVAEARGVILLCLALSFVIAGTHFLRQFPQLLPAVRDRRWRSFMSVE